jgi:NADH dehydrogenase
VAIQMGEHTARNIRAEIGGKPRAPFVYRDKGQLAVIGRGRAVADIGRVRYSGMLAWLIWVFVHIFFLIGFRNRVIVLFEWAWAYFTYQRGARLITKPWSTGSHREATPGLSPGASGVPRAERGVSHPLPGHP